MFLLHLVDGSLMTDVIILRFRIKLIDIWYLIICGSTGMMDSIFYCLPTPSRRILANLCLHFLYQPRSAVSFCLWAAPHDSKILPLEQYEHRFPGSMVTLYHCCVPNWWHPCSTRYSEKRLGESMEHDWGSIYLLISWMHAHILTSWSVHRGHQFFLLCTAINWSSFFLSTICSVV